MQHSDLEQKNFKNFSQTPIFFRIFIIFFFIIWTLFSLFFIHNATQHHKMTCSYKSNFCEIQIFDIKEFKYQTTHQIPLSEIKYMYLKKFEHSDDSRESYKLILKTKTVPNNCCPIPSSTENDFLLCVSFFFPFLHIKGIILLT